LVQDARRPAKGAEEDGEVRRSGTGGDQQGFTLVEVAVTVALVGIVAMLAMPSILGVVPRIQLSNDTVTVANEVALARARAISQNYQTRISFNEAGDSYTLWTGVDTDADGKRDSLQSFSTSTAASNIDLHAVQNLGPQNTLVLQPTGEIGRLDASSNFEKMPLGTLGRIHLKTLDDAYQKRVIIEPTGRVYVQRSTDNGGSWWED